MGSLVDVEIQNWFETEWTCKISVSDRIQWACTAWFQMASENWIFCAVAVMIQNRFEIACNEHALPGCRWHLNVGSAVPAPQRCWFGSKPNEPAKSRSQTEQNGHAFTDCRWHLKIGSAVPSPPRYKNGTKPNRPVKSRSQTETHFNLHCACIWCSKTVFARATRCKMIVWVDEALWRRYYVKMQ